MEKVMLEVRGMKKTLSKENVPESNSVDIKEIIGKQISSLLKQIEEKSNSLSIEENIVLHRQLESYISTCYRYEILPLNENEIVKYSLDVKTIIEKLICAISKRIEEKSDNLSIQDSIKLHELLESYITSYKYYKINRDLKRP